MLILTLKDITACQVTFEETIPQRAVVYRGQCYIFDCSYPPTHFSEAVRQVQSFLDKDTMCLLLREVGALTLWLQDHGEARNPLAGRHGVKLLNSNK